jgi:hypothetical protein
MDSSRTPSDRLKASVQKLLETAQPKTQQPSTTPAVHIAGDGNAVSFGDLTVHHHSPTKPALRPRRK